MLPQIVFEPNVSPVCALPFALFCWPKHTFSIQSCDDTRRIVLKGIKYQKSWLVADIHPLDKHHVYLNFFLFDSCVFKWKLNTAFNTWNIEKCLFFKLSSLRDEFPKGIQRFPGKRELNPGIWGAYSRFYLRASRLFMRGYRHCIPPSFVVKFWETDEIDL